MVVIKTDGTKVKCRSRIFFRLDCIDVVPYEDTPNNEMVRILFDDIKYIDSNQYQNINEKD